MKSVDARPARIGGTPVSEIVSSVRYAGVDPAEVERRTEDERADDEQDDDRRERVDEAPDAEAVHGVIVGAWTTPARSAS